MTARDAQLIELFLEDQEKLGRSHSTIKIRRTYLNHFLKDNGTMEVTSSQIQKWLNSRKLKESTKSIYLFTYSQFYKWANSCRFLEEDPTARIMITSQPPQTSRVSFEPDDVLRAVEAGKTSTVRSASAGEMSCWVALAAFQGMKCGEMSDLTAEEVNLTGQVIEYRIESRWPRSTILHPVAVQALEALPMPAHGRLFPDSTAARISKALSQHLHDCGIVGSASSLVRWHGQQVEVEGKHFGRYPDVEAKFDQSGIDSALWEHIASYCANGDWSAVALHSERYTEDRVRQWANLPMDMVGETLMSKAFGEEGVLRLGALNSERQGWHRLAMGISMALRNVDAHRIQDRSDLKQYASGVLGACSLLVTQLRYEYGERID
jgi:hypothetical protein